MDNSPNQYAIREGGQDPWRLVMLLVATSVEINTMITASYGGFGGLGQE